MGNTIYLDHAATTEMRPEVRDVMIRYLSEEYGNPSTLYEGGRRAKAALDLVRERVSHLLGASPEEIIFTGGGSEADNLAIIGTALAQQEKGHIVTSGIEHKAVLETVRFLERLGFTTTIIPVGSDGLVDPEQVRRSLAKDTVLVSIMHANNEVGTIQPIQEIGEILREREICFHTDAVQTVGHIPVDVRDLGVDLLSFSAHKFYGPKGVGALFVRKGVKLNPLIHGGGQELGLRSGTENVAGIVGLGKALELACDEVPRETARLSNLRERLMQGIEKKIPGALINGSRSRRLPNNVSVCFESIEADVLILDLDSYGIAASSGSACACGSLKTSHVLTAMGVGAKLADGALRLTLGRDNTEEQVDYVLKILPAIIDDLRSLSC